MRQFSNIAANQIIPKDQKGGRRGWWRRQQRLTIQGGISTEGAWLLPGHCQWAPAARHCWVLLFTVLPPSLLLPTSAPCSERRQQWAATARELIYLRGKKRLWWFPSGCNCAHYCPFTFHHSIIANASLLLIRVCRWTARWLFIPSFAVTRRTSTRQDRTGEGWGRGMGLEERQEVRKVFYQIWLKAVI